MKIALMSAAALAVVFAAPAHAQQLQTTPMTPAPVVALDQPVMATQVMTAEDLRGVIEAIGIEEAAEFEGKLVRAQMVEGFPVLVLAGPSDFDAEATIEIDAQGMRDGLEAGGLLQTQQVELHFMRGRLDDNAVLVMGGDGNWGHPPLVTRGELERSEIEQKLGEAGVQDVGAFEGHAFRAWTEEGGTILMILGPDDFAAGATVEVDAEDILERLREAGLQNPEEMDEAVMARGTIDDHAVIALAGMPLIDVPATGAVPPRQ
jgi:hypothetical protein